MNQRNFFTMLACLLLLALSATAAMADDAKCSALATASFETGGSQVKIESATLVSMFRWFQMV